MIGEVRRGAEPALSAAEVVAILIRRGQTVAVAESLTGGLLTATLVDVPGASGAVRGGLVVYATELKESLAGVPGSLLSALGPVDARVAHWLAWGARRRCGADWGLSATGVAGPEPQNGVPVGTIFVGVAGPDDPAPDPRAEAADQRDNVRGLTFSGDRAAIRWSTVVAALDLLTERLLGRRPAR